jgi:ELWxxDGT repeat protein
VGTVIVKDIKPGSASSVPWGLINANGTLYFQADDGNSGPELWKSDGTAGGTIMVKDIKPGTNGSEPASLTNVNGTVYFQAQDGISGIELWKSDGTLAGTVMLKDINPGPSWSEPNDFTNVNGILYFYALSPTAGQELWKSDGTSAGTVMVIDIATGTNSSSPDNLTNVNGTLFFVALNGSGRELWALSIPTSIEQNNSGDSGILIYPNPTNGKSKINFSSNSISKIEIYNLQGEKVITMEKNYQRTLDDIDISGLNKGIYVVKMFEGERSYSKKLIVQ